MSDRGDRLREADRVFALALDLEGEDRDALVVRECGDDLELLAEVRALLATAADSDAYLGESHDQLLGRIWNRVEGDEEAGSLADTRLGPYRLEALIARGGMGSVYRARREDGRYDSEVAIKVLRRGLDTEDVIRRFEAERRILAALEHPNIARLLDAGEAEDGRPYLVMELVEGRPIIEFCDSVRATIETRLGLFAEVCEAVSHAHRHLVIHRDLKSTNIFVTEGGSETPHAVAVKLLDFGIAKLVDPDGDPGTQGLTRTGVRLLTPLCASPEQVAGETVTTASDVYQLGLLLYELLAGRTPHEREDGTTPGGVSLDEAIRRGDLPAPSRRLPELVAENRSTDAPTLLRELRGDLDAIVLKALRTEPESRYESVTALASDLEAFGQGLPVSATADSRAYRTRKFVRRHRAGVTIAAAAMALISGWAITASLQNRVISAERDRVQEEASRTTAIRDFLVSMFEVSDPFQPAANAGDSTSARELLDAGASRLASELADQPAARAELAFTIGKTYRNLDLVESARPLLEQAVEIQTDLEGPRGPAVVRPLYELALLLRGTDRDSALALFDRALELGQESLGPEHPLVAEMMTYTANHMWSTSSADTTRMRTLYQRAVTILRDNPEAPRSQLAEALTLSSYGAPSDIAVPAISEALEIRRELYGENHPIVAGSLNDLSLALEFIEPARSDSLMEAAFRIYEATLGVEHRTTLTVMGNLAASYRDIRKDYDAAEALYRRSISIREARRPDDGLGLAYPLFGLALTLMTDGRFEEAEPPLRRTHELLVEEVGWGHGLTYTTRVRLGECLRNLGRLEEAASLLESSREGFDRTPGLDTGNRLMTLRALRRVYEVQGRTRDMERMDKEIAALSGDP